MRTLRFTVLDGVLADSVPNAAAQAIAPEHLDAAELRAEAEALQTRFTDTESSDHSPTAQHRAVASELSEGLAGLPLGGK